MAGRDYNNYNYYNPHQAYMADGGMMPQPVYFDHSQQWGWQGQGYGAGPQFYGGYPQMPVNYGYGYENHDGFNNQQNYQSYEPSQDSSSRKSKHSYSQNRNRNRSRYENRQQNYDLSAANNIVQNAGEHSTVDVSGANNDNTNNNALPDNNMNNTITAESSNNESSKPHDRGKGRTGRFHGTDTRIKQYDKEKQIADRQKNYNKTYVAADDGGKKVTGKKDAENQATGNKTSTSVDETKGARPKSYKDQRNNRHNQDKREKESWDGHKKSSDKIKDDAAKTGDDKEGKDETGEHKDNGGRRKKKDYQHVYSTSSSPREWQGKPSSAYGSQQEAYDRYNYRGQDYNKRHKDPAVSAIERGGDRMKLSSQFNNKGDESSEKKKEEDCDLIRAHTDTGRKKHTGGPARGIRHRKGDKMDESQRGLLIEQLSRGTYECMVCCETIRAQNAVWSCTNCHHVFHLRCIKKWARSPNAVVSGAEKDGWRCPACQNLSFKFPNQYRCFCGKVKDPEPSRMDTPHSCGDVCQKDRGDGCKHPCNILCHPGPCPECNATVTKSCDCGKTQQTVKCSQSMTIKCELVCEKLLNCGRHYCQAKCHSGQCDMCVHIIKQECFGHHESREVVCGSEDSFQTSYSCKTICSKSLDCGNHSCDRECHNGDCESCIRLPGNVTHCPCGAQTLADLGAQPRTSCLDPIATCSAICNKTLNCGPPGDRHRCDKVCHEGDCGPCNGTTMLTCRCLSMDKEFKCSEIDAGFEFLCERRCNRKKLCGRHKCGQPCCVKEEHPCEMICGRKLPCGLHKCMEPCHKNNCPPCLMAGFDELTCYCGAEIMYPPIPCGTSPPECHRTCTRNHGCDHPVRHNCHSDEKCTPCTELTKKMCMGNHVLRLNIPCHLTDISCGMRCSKPLPCGEHTCIKTCHKGPCLEDGQPCNQPCQRKRELCEHVCGAPCHGETPCPQTACKAKVTLKCSCGNRESDTLCSIGATGDSSEFQKITMQSLKDSIQGIMGASSSVNIGKFSQARLGQGRILDCNEECALLERNRRLAQALDIQNADLSNKVSPAYTDYLKEYAKKEPAFVASIEKALGDLVVNAKQSKHPSRSHVFPSMNLNQRKVVHELAEMYGCNTQSYDFEPKKNVVATASRDKCWVPTVTLTSLVQRELHPRAPPPIPHIHREESLRMTNLASKQSTLLLGERDKSSSPEGWHVIGTKKTKKSTTNPTNKSAISTIDKFEPNLADICATGMINYDQLTKESKEALKSEPVVDYFDFTVN